MTNLLSFEEHLINTMGISIEQDSVNHNAVLMQGHTIKSLWKEIWYGLSESIQDRISLGLTLQLHVREHLDNSV